MVDPTVKPLEKAQPYAVSVAARPARTPEVGEHVRCTYERELADSATVQLRSLVDGGDLDLRFVACACRPGTEGTRRCNYGRACAHLLARGKRAREGRRRVADRGQACTAVHLRSALVSAPAAVVLMAVTRHKPHRTVSLSGAYLDVSRQAKRALHLIALYGFERLRQLIGPLQVPFHGHPFLEHSER